MFTVSTSLYFVTLLFSLKIFAVKIYIEVTEVQNKLRRNFVNSWLKYDKTKKWFFRKSIWKFWTFFVSLKHNSVQTAKLSMKIPLEWLFSSFDKKRNTRTEKIRQNWFRHVLTRKKLKSGENFVWQKHFIMFYPGTKINRKFRVITEIGSTFFGWWSVTRQLKIKYDFLSSVWNFQSIEYHHALFWKFGTLAGLWPLAIVA
jgi:hypothetical protein